MIKNTKICKNNTKMIKNTKMINNIKIRENNTSLSVFRLPVELWEIIIGDDVEMLKKLFERRN